MTKDLSIHFVGRRARLMRGAGQAGRGDYGLESGPGITAILRGVGRPRIYKMSDLSLAHLG